VQACSKSDSDDGPHQGLARVAEERGSVTQQWAHSNMPKRKAKLQFIVTPTASRQLESPIRDHERLAILLFEKIDRDGDKESQEITEMLAGMVGQSAKDLTKKYYELWGPCKL
jgi:hypothetical protein